MKSKRDQEIVFLKPMFDHPIGHRAILRVNGHVSCGKVCSGWLKSEKNIKIIKSLPKNGMKYDEVFKSNAKKPAQKSDRWSVGFEKSYKIEQDTTSGKFIQFLDRSAVIFANPVSETPCGILKAQSNLGERSDYIRAVISVPDGNVYVFLAEGKDHKDTYTNLGLFSRKTYKKAIDLVLKHGKKIDDYNKKNRVDIPEHHTSGSNPFPYPSYDEFTHYNPVHANVNKAVEFFMTSDNKLDYALIAIDVSGSIDTENSRKRLETYAKYLRSTLSLKWPEAVTFTTSIQKNGYLNQIVESLTGTGGTDIKCVIDFAKEHGIKNVLMFSDGEFESAIDKNTRTFHGYPGMKLAVITPDDKFIPYNLIVPPEKVQPLITRVDAPVTHEQALLKWLSGLDTGLSSSAIALRALGLKSAERWAYPQDNNDFGRCYRLLQACPFIDIKIMEKVSPIWAQLVRIWNALTKMYEAQISIYAIIIMILDLLPAEDGGLNQRIMKKPIT